MAGSGRQPLEGEEELGADVAGFEPVGGGSEGIRSLLQGNSLGRVAVWGRDVGPDPHDGAVPEYFSPQGRATSHREKAKEWGGGSWDYPLLAPAMVEAGFEESRTYVMMRQNTVAQYILTQLILDLCGRSAWRPGAWVSRQ